MINHSYSMECDSCDTVLRDTDGKVLRASSVRSLNMAAYSRGWWVSPSDHDDHIGFCPPCRVEEGL